MRASFFLYFMPSDRQDTALVTAIGGRAWTSILYASVLMNSDRIFASVNCAGQRSRRVTAFALDIVPEAKHGEHARTMQRFMYVHRICSQLSAHLAVPVTFELVHFGVTRAHQRWLYNLLWEMSHMTTQASTWG